MGSGLNSNSNPWLKPLKYPNPTNPVRETFLHHHYQPLGVSIRAPGVRLAALEDTNRQPKSYFNPKDIQEAQCRKLKLVPCKITRVCPRIIISTTVFLKFSSSFSVSTCSQNLTAWRKGQMPSITLRDCTTWNSNTCHHGHACSQLHTWRARAATLQTRQLGRRVQVCILVGFAITAVVFRELLNMSSLNQWMNEWIMLWFLTVTPNYCPPHCQSFYVQIPLVRYLRVNDAEELVITFIFFACVSLTSGSVKSMFGQEAIDCPSFDKSKKRTGAICLFIG